ncbi:MAG TPA: M48 family metalloprotease [Burkholderiales bacterium]|nr:M48 family metalloprotease [Burkholderiales bacterium]
MSRRSFFAVVILAATFGPAAHAASIFNVDINRAANAVKNLGTAATGIEEKDEIALGRELAGRTMGAAPLVNDANVQRYVNKVGRAIAAQSDRPDLPWRFGVIDTGSVNAFAAPGGVILVTRGLYEILENEAQLAAVLGHEVAHVMKRHHVEVMRKQAGTQGLAGAAQTYLQATGRDRTGIADKVLGEGAELFTKSLDRDAEYEADLVGTTLAAKAGYSVSGMIDVLQKLRARAGDPSANLLYETHPHPNDRLTKLGETIEPQLAKLPPGEEPPPPLQVAGDSLPAPVAGRAAPAAPGRALAQESQQSQQQQDGAGLGGVPGVGQGVRRGGAAIPGLDMFRGIMGGGR